jgi:hypothetical protein
VHLNGQKVSKEDVERRARQTEAFAGSNADRPLLKQASHQRADSGTNRKAAVM